MKGTEAGKIRPCLVVQNDVLCEINHSSTMVLPLTTLLIDDVEPLRYRINLRDKLQFDSDIMIDQVRTVDNKRITNNVLTTLSNNEMLEVDMLWQIVLGLN